MEASHLQISDIDSHQMQLRVARGKGNKERLVPISPRLLTELREYWNQQLEAHGHVHAVVPGGGPALTLCGRRVIYGACSAAHVIGRMFYGPQNAQPRMGETQSRNLQVLTNRDKLHPRFDACFVAEIGHIRCLGSHAAAVELDS